MAFSVVLLLILPTILSARMDQDDLKRYFHKENSFAFITDTLEIREDRVEQAIANRENTDFLPHDEAMARDVLKDYIRVEQLLHQRVFQESAVAQKELKRLHDIFDHESYSVPMRWPSALLLYLETDDLTYLKGMMMSVRQSDVNRTVYPGYIKMFAEVRDDQFYELLVDLLSDVSEELLWCRFSESLYGDQELHDHTREGMSILMLNYPELCIAVYRHQLTSAYADFFFQNYSIMRKYTTSFKSTADIAAQLYEASPDICTSFVLTLLKQGAFEEVKELCHVDKPYLASVNLAVEEYLSALQQDSDKIKALGTMIREFDQGTFKAVSSVLQ